jgi:predicted site-specific integrase-resolvase
MREPRLWPVCLSVAEWSRSLGVQRAVIYQWCRAGLPIYCVGTKRRILTDDIVAFCRTNLKRLELKP